MKRIIIIFITILIYLTHFSYGDDKNSQVSMSPFKSSQLTKYTTEELINYLTLESINWHFNNDRSEIEFEIRDELIRRKDIPKLIDAYENPKDEYQKEKMMDILYQIDDQTILTTFKKYVSPNEITKTMYYCLNYLAKHGDKEALGILNNNYFQYPVSSLQWAYTVKLFGKLHYMLATDNMVNSLDDASLNLVDAALESLYILYPDAPRDYNSPEEAKNIFEEYLAQ